MFRFIPFSRIGLSATRPVSRQAFPSIKFTTTRRPTSWIAFEAPSPTLYAHFLKSAKKSVVTPKSETGDDTQKMSPEAAPPTSSGKTQQGYATSQPTTPSGRRDSEKEGNCAACASPDSQFLSTTLIQIHGCPATWACE